MAPDWRNENNRKRKCFARLLNIFPAFWLTYSAFETWKSSQGKGSQGAKTFTRGRSIFHAKRSVSALAETAKKWTTLQRYPTRVALTQPLTKQADKKEISETAIPQTEMIKSGERRHATATPIVGRNSGQRRHYFFMFFWNPVSLPLQDRPPPHPLSSILSNHKSVGELENAHGKISLLQSHSVFFFLISFSFRGYLPCLQKRASQWSKHDDLKEASIWRPSVL